jgi:hypothetical protein
LGNLLSGQKSTANIAAKGPQHNYAIVNSDMNEDEVKVLRGNDDYVSLPEPSGSKVLGVPIPGSNFANREAVATKSGTNMGSSWFTHKTGGTRYNRNHVVNPSLQARKRRGDPIHQAELQLKLDIMRASRSQIGSKYNVAFMPPKSDTEYNLQREDSAAFKKRVEYLAKSVLLPEKEGTLVLAHGGNCKKVMETLYNNPKQKRAKQLGINFKHDFSKVNKGAKNIRKLQFGDSYVLFDIAGQGKVWYIVTRFGEVRTPKMKYQEAKKTKTL